MLRIFSKYVRNYLFGVPNPAKIKTICRRRFGAIRRTKRNTTMLFPQNKQTKFTIWMFWYPKQSARIALWDLMKIENRFIYVHFIGTFW